jgi:hypothetical protein
MSKEISGPIQDVNYALGRPMMRIVIDAETKQFGIFVAEEPVPVIPEAEVPAIVISEPEPPVIVKVRWYAQVWHILNLDVREAWRMLWNWMKG